MKKFLSLLFVGLIASVCFWSCSDDDDDDVVIDSNSLPHVANMFLQTYFTDDEPTSITKETGTNGGYDVELTSGIKVEFDANGQWKDVEGTLAAQLPNQDFIPAPIREYVAENFGKYNFGINAIERTDNGYEVQLTTLLKLLFDAQGNYLGRDE